jgi:hypothetical protein
MPARVIQWPKFSRLSTEPQHLARIQQCCQLLWEQRGSPKGKPQVIDWVEAQKENHVYDEMAYLRLKEGVLVLCYYEYQFLPSSQSCYNCGGDGALQPEVRVYNILEAKNTAKIAKPSLLHQALREITRIKFAGRYPWCFRQECQQAFRALKEWREPALRR